MVEQWMRVGFVHGVMNTDNMSVLGLTIDYGPYGWIDNYDERWTPNTTDLPGRRYCFGAQLEVALWNLSRFGSALVPLLDSPEGLQAALDRSICYGQTQLETMWATKLGFATADQLPAELVPRLRQRLQAREIDMTIFFRRLAELDITAEPSSSDDHARWLATLMAADYDEVAPKQDEGEAWIDWLAAYAQAHREGTCNLADRRTAMNRVNPNLVLRNYLAQELIDGAETGDIAPTRRLFEALKRPYDDEGIDGRYLKKRPDWARQRAGCSQLSCSS